MWDGRWKSRKVSRSLKSCREVEFPKEEPGDEIEKYRAGQVDCRSSRIEEKSSNQARRRGSGQSPKLHFVMGSMKRLGEKDGPGIFWTGSKRGAR